MTAESASLEARDLQQAIAWAARALPRKPAVPVLAAMAVSVGDGQLHVQAFDYDVHATAVCPATGEILRVLVSGATLAAAAAHTSDQVRLGVDGAGRLVIASGRDRWRLMTMPDDYPSVPDMPTGWVPVDNLAEALAQVTPAASRDLSLPALTGVSLHAEAGRLRLMCTDRYQLARRVIDWDGPDLDALAPAETLTSLVSHLGTGQRLAVDAGRVAVTDGTRTASCYQIDTQFPRAEVFFDRAAHEATAVEVGRRDLLSAVASAAVTASVADSRRMLDLAVGDDQLVIASHGDPAGHGALAGDSRVEVPLRRIGPETAAVTLSETYLTNALKALTAGVVRLYPGRSEQPPRPGLLCGVRDGELELDAAHIIMPIRKVG